MIKSLYIKNFAIIREQTITFDQGFTVITGETGSGKSIILGALHLILGERASSSQTLLDPGKNCVIEGEFDISHYGLKPFFETHDLLYDDSIIIRREILPTGKSRAFVQDSPCTLQILQALSDRLLDIHSQFDTHMLGKTDFQREVLDSLWSGQSVVRQYSIQYKELRQKQKELDLLRSRESQNNSRLDYLQFLSSELEELNTFENEDTELENSLALEENKEVLKQLMAGFHALFTQENGPVDQLRHLLRQLSDYQDLDQISDVYSRINSLSIEMYDLGKETGVLEEELEYNPATIQEIQDRLDLLNRLLTKHHAQSSKELQEKHQEIDNEILALQNTNSNTDKLQTEINNLENALKLEAEEISTERKKVIPALKESIESRLSSLNMENTRFEVVMQETDELNPYGKDHVRFDFSANPGSPTQPIQKIASGGELSRLALSIKTLVASTLPLPTLIFDEIDAGISGDVSDKMGTILKATAQKHQIIAITHSPQIASKANLHLQVQKKTDGQSSETIIQSLSKKERLEEIATMLSSYPPSAAALKNAKELLSSSL